MPRRLAALACAAALVAACSPSEPVAGTSEPPGATDHCTAAERVAIQGQGHLVGNQEPPVAYNSTPPTSGWHTATEVPLGIADAPLSEPEQVSVLEEGGIVITHNGLLDTDLGQLEDLVTQRYPSEAALTLYPKLAEGEVALAAWGAVQRCSAVDIPAVEAFVAAFSQR
jgi:hypothetical protein